MGTVLEAWDPVIDRRVAIKTVKLPGTDDAEMQDELHRFRREAQAAGRLTHPNIVGVFDYGETAELAYIVMEFVDGQSVKGKLDSNERFAPPAIARLMEDLLNGLNFSHAAGVIHRDIKPANIMLTKAGQAKIADFGIARIESSSMTQAGTLLGTPAYMSPEQFRGETVDLRTDIYSSGVMLYQLLTGDRPFEGNLSSIMHKALTVEPPAPSILSATAPRGLDGVVARAMAKRPEDRFPTAAAFLAAIHAAMAAPEAVHGPASDATVFVTPPKAVPVSVSPATTAPTVRSKAPLLLGGVAAALVTAGVAAFVFLGSGSKDIPNAPASSPVPALPIPAAIPAAIPPGPVLSPKPPVVPSPAVPQQEASKPQQTPAVPMPPTPAPREQQPVVASVPPPREPPVSVPLATVPQASPASPFIVPAVPVPMPADTTASQPPATVPVQPLRLATNEPSPAAPTIAAVRQRVAAVIEARDCTAVTGDVIPGGSVQLRGFTGPGGLPALTQAIAGAASSLQDDGQVAEADPSYCPALSAVATLLPPFGSAAPHVVLTEASGSERLVDGDYIRPRTQMPPFAANLLLDYYAHDGTVEHIFPRTAVPSQKMPADPNRVFAASETVTFGEPNSRRPTFQVGEPYGRDMIVAVASSQPLFPSGRARNGEQSAAYARDLRTAIDQARGRGARLSAAVIRLDTVAK